MTELYHYPAASSGTAHAGDDPNPTRASIREKARQAALDQVAAERRWRGLPPLPETEAEPTAPATLEAPAATEPTGMRPNPLQGASGTTGLDMVPGTAPTLAEQLRDKARRALYPDTPPAA